MRCMQHSRTVLVRRVLGGKEDQEATFPITLLVVSETEMVRRGIGKVHPKTETVKVHSNRNTQLPLGSGMIPGRSSRTEVCRVRFLLVAPSIV